MRKSRVTTLLFSVAFLLIVSTKAYADIWDGGKFMDGIAMVNFDSSVESYGYTAHYESAMENWNGITNNVHVFKAGSHEAADVYYAGNSSVEGRLGIMIPYDRYGRVVDVDRNWYRATSHIYDNNMKSYNMTKAQIISNATHEIGHTLKLAHPSSSVRSVMNQGIQSIGPTEYDKNELKRKWD